MTTTGSTAQVLDINADRGLISVRTRAQQLVLRSYEDSSISLKDYAEQAIEYAQSAVERNRRAATDRRVRILRDEWGPLLKGKFTNWVTPEVRGAVLGAQDDHIDLSRNPFKQITKELSVAYKSPARRSTPTKKTDGEKYKKLLEGTGFDLFWQQVERLVEACNEVLIWPEVVELGGKKIIKHRYAPGNCFTLITTEADPTIVEAVVLIDEYVGLSGDKHIKYKIWTEHWHGEFEDGSDGIKQTGYVDPNVPAAEDGSSANPYKELCFYLVRKNDWPDLILDITTEEDLVDLTLNIGVTQQFLNYMRKMSGFKQLAVSGASIDRMPQSILDPAKALNFTGGDNTSVQVIDWTVNLGAYIDEQDRQELNAAASRGINPERYKAKGNYQTGTGAALSERGLAETRIGKLPIYQRAEAAYKRLCAIVWRAHGIRPEIDQDTPLEVEHAPIYYPTDPKAQADLDKTDISLGLESPVSIYMKRHPEVKEDEAIKAIEHNMEQTARVQEMKVTHNMPNDPEKESRTAEENGRLGPEARDNMPTPPGAPPGLKSGEEEQA